MSGIHLVKYAGTKPVSVLRVKAKTVSLEFIAWFESDYGKIASLSEVPLAESGIKSNWTESRNSRGSSEAAVWLVSMLVLLLKTSDSWSFCSYFSVKSKLPKLSNKSLVFIAIFNKIIKVKKTDDVFKYTLVKYC